MSLTLALLEPDIPQNTGAMLRTCACLGVDCALIEPAGFPVSDKRMRRAGMDYLDQVKIERYRSFTDFNEKRRIAGRRLILLTTKSGDSYVDFQFSADDILLMGRESAGAPNHVHAVVDNHVRIPMMPGMRSLNVGIAAAMALGEALRQTRGFYDQGKAEKDKAEKDKAASAPVLDPRDGAFSDLKNLREPL